MKHLQAILQCAILVSAVEASAAPATASETTKTAPASERIAVAHLDLDGMILEAPLLFATRYEATSQYAIDRDRTMFDSKGVDTVFRIGARFDSKRVLVPLLVLAEYEHDLFTGMNSTLPTLGGEGYPFSQPSTDQLRKLYGRLSLGWYAHAGFGFNTSHWGLGLIANDGAHGFTPSSPSFTDPRGGDRVLRGFLASGPHTDAKIFASVAIDSVVSDEAMLEGDSAKQLVAAVLVGRNLPHTAGLYVVRRNQTSGTGGEINVTVIDGTAKTSGEIEGLGTYTLEGEFAHIFGQATVAGSPEFPTQDVSQLGAALRASLDAGFMGGVIDLLYASGDENIDDGGQHGFKADPNYALGLVLHRHLFAAATARAVHNASNPNLLGVPPRGLDRFPTKGSITDTVAFFPRAFWRPVEELEIYSGPLFAWSATSVVDPLRTRLAGGAPRNAFDREPGSYLGTELDVGARFRSEILGSQLELGGEFGVLIPGSAFAGSSYSVYGGRAFVQYRL
jgi:hypothetical protein